jgi:hypothetical protein
VEKCYQDSSVKLYHDVLNGRLNLWYSESAEGTYEVIHIIMRQDLNQYVQKKEMNEQMNLLKRKKRRIYVCQNITQSQRYVITRRKINKK